MSNIFSYQTFHQTDLNVEWCAICYTPFDQREHAPVSHIQTLPGTSERVQIACNRAFCCLACYPTWSHHEVSGRACPLCRGPREFMVIRHPVEGELCFSPLHRNQMIRNGGFVIRLYEVYQNRAEALPNNFPPFVPLHRNQIIIRNGVVGVPQNRAEALADISPPSLQNAMNNGVLCAAFYVALIVYDTVIFAGRPPGGMILASNCLVSGVFFSSSWDRYCLYRLSTDRSSRQQLVAEITMLMAVGIIGIGGTAVAPIVFPWLSNWEAVSTLFFISTIFVTGTAAFYVGQRVGGEWQRAYVIEHAP